MLHGSKKLINNSSEKYSIKTLMKGASVYSLGEVLAKSSGFFLIPIYTRVLTPREYGIVGYLEVFLQIMTCILSFGFHGAQTRYYYEKLGDSEALGRFTFTINLTSIGVGLLVFLPLGIIGAHNKWVIGSSAIPFYPYFTLSMGVVLLQVISQNIIHFFRAKKEYVRTSILNSIKFIFVTVFTILMIVVFHQKALGRITGLFLGTLLFVLLFFWSYGRYFIYRFSKSDLIYAITFGAPVVIHLLMGTIHNAIDRIILEQMVSLEELGIYTLGFTIGNVMQLFITAFNQAYQPNYYHLMGSECLDKELQLIKTFKIWLFFITLIAILGIVLGGPFLKIFAGSDYVRAAKLLPYFIFAFYIGGYYYFFSSPIFFYKQTKWLPILTGSSALLNIILNFLLIPKFGTVGAVIATAISHAWLSFFSLQIGNKIFKVCWPYKLIVFSIITVTVFLLIVV